MDRDSFIFYRSFFEASKPLPKEQKAELFDQICEYALNQNEIDLQELPKAMFQLIKPQLDANYKRYVNGKKGGRKTKLEPKRNQNETKIESNANYNVNVNVNEKEIYRDGGHLSITWGDANKLIDEFGAEKADEYINRVLNYRKNSTYKSLYLTALNWLRRDTKQDKTNGKKNKLSI